MKILIDGESVCPSIQNQICTRYEDIISERRKTGFLRLVNGDTIKVRNWRGRDGANADIVVGDDNNQNRLIACMSRYNNAVWDATQLYHYLDDVKEKFNTIQKLNGSLDEDVSDTTKCSNKNLRNINVKLNVDVSSIKDISIGLRLVDALRWEDEYVNFECILKSDKDTKDIIINESDLMRLIQIVNPGQKEKRITLLRE